MAPPVGGPVYNWPMAITAGDISRYGRRILVRNYPGKYHKVGVKFKTLIQNFKYHNSF